MERILLVLQPELGSFRIFFLVFGILDLICAAAIESDLRYLCLLAGIAAVLLSIFFPHLFRSGTATFDERAIEVPESPYRTQRITRIEWQDIARIEMKKFSFDIHTKAGGVHRVDLSSISFPQHNAIRPRILELAASKGIDARSS